MNAPQRPMTEAEAKEQQAQQEAFEKAMSVEHTITFTKKELTVIFNILTGVQAKYGDFLAIMPIVHKIEPIVVQEAHIVTEKKEGVLVN